MIEWSGGNLEFANGAFLGSPMPKIYMDGGIAFCAEWNGQPPSGDYVQSGEGSDPAIKQILANYDNSGKSNADYAAAQAAIWAHIMGTSVSSWGGCPGSSSADKILNGSHDTSSLKYNYTSWTGGTQDLITYNTEEEPDPKPDIDPDDYPEDEYRIEVETDTQTETEVRNRKSYEYSDAIGQITIRKHDQDEKSLDGALFDIDVAFSDGTHTTVENWEVDNGARLFTWTHPKDNHDPATVTVTEVRPPHSYEMDPTPQTAVVAPTYTRITHVETWTVTIVTETTSSTVIEIASGEVAAESKSSSSAETESDPQVEEFTDFIEGDRETTMTFVNTATPCSLTVYKYETGKKSVALEEFYWRDMLPDEARLGKIVTGTWSERLTYSIEYKTNRKNRWRTLKDGLSSKVSYTLDCGRENLKLAADEYVAEFRFNFGTVQPGFCEETGPVIFVTALANLKDGYRIVNRTDAGGRTGEEWVIGKDNWITWSGTKTGGICPRPASEMQEGSGGLTVAAPRFMMINPV